MAEDLSKVYQNLLYSKQTYDKGKADQNKGQQTWAANNANQYYSQLGADEAATIKGLNSQGLADYIKNKQTPTSEVTTSSISGGGGGSGGGALNAQGYIDQLNAARRSQVLADLGKSRDNALSNLAGEKSAIAPKYYDARNTTAAGSQQTARNLAEYMAARGGSSSGTNAQMELARNMSLQGNLGSLGRQEAADFSDIERRTTGVNNAYESDLASATAGLEGDRMQSLLNDYYQQQQKDLQLAGLMGTYNGQKTLAATAQDQNYGLNLAGLSGQLPGGGKTLQAQGQQFDQNMATNQFNLQKASTEWNQAFQQGQFDFQKGQAAWENAFKDKSFNQSVKDAAASRGLQWANLNQSQQQFVAREAWDKKVYEDSQGWKQKEWDWMQNPSNPDNTKNKVDFTSEYQGLQAGLTSGALKPDVALVEIKNMMDSGQLSAAEAQQMMNLITPYKANQLNGR